MRKWLDDYGLYVIWIISLVATGGSLYFSEVIGFIPCKLCWVQRIFMYPFVIIFGIATYKGDKAILTYTLPLSIIGFGVASYHYVFVQKFPGLLNVFEPCQEGVPCDTEYINLLGFITIPFLSWVAFSLITLISLLLVFRK